MNDHFPFRHEAKQDVKTTQRRLVSLLRDTHCCVVRALVGETPTVLQDSDFTWRLQDTGEWDPVHHKSRQKRSRVHALRARQTERVLGLSRVAWSGVKKTLRASPRHVVTLSEEPCVQPDETECARSAFSACDSVNSDSCFMIKKEKGRERAKCLPSR